MKPLSIYSTLLVYMEPSSLFSLYLGLKRRGNHFFIQRRGKATMNAKGKKLDLIINIYLT